MSTDKHKMPRGWKRAARNEKGAAMALVLVFMALAALVVPPVLSYVSTGFKTSMIYEDNTRQLYAAESGINDGIWYARYDDFSSIFGSSYKQYDFQTTWDYDLEGTVNGYTVNVALENVWIPSNITPPSDIEARTIIENGLLMLSGSAPAESNTYRIRLSFFPDGTNDPKIETLGLWLPPGFTYVEGSCNLEQDTGASYYPQSVDVFPHASGQAVLWDFWSVPVDEFGPDVDTEGTAVISTITFDYIAQEQDQRPAAVSWATTSGALDVPYTWDADTRIFHITGTAGDTCVEGYVGKSEVRDLDSAMNGDYLAVGNTLMTATSNQYERDRLFRESSAVVAEDDLPETATIQSARLYWSGWIDRIHEIEIFNDVVSGDQWDPVWEDDCSELPGWQAFWQDDCSELPMYQAMFQDDCSSLDGISTIWSDSCGNFNHWQEGSVWSISSGAFRARNSSADPGDLPETYPQSTVTLDSGEIDLSTFGSGDVTVTWQQYESGTLESDDRLYYQFYGNGAWGGLNEAFRDDIGSTPVGKNVVVPDGYLAADFRLRFFATGFSGSSEYCYLDNVTFSAPLSGGWDAGTDWQVVSGRFRGHHSGADANRYLTLSENIDLGTYAGQSLQLSWEQTEEGNLSGSDGLQFRISGDGGLSWSGWESAFSGNNPVSPFTHPIPSEYATSQFRLQFYLAGFGISGRNAYIDNVTISRLESGTWDAGGDWQVISGRFRGHHSGTDANRFLTIMENIDLSTYAGQTVRLSWDQYEDGYLSSSDGLQFQVSGDGGATWSVLEDAFRGNSPVSPWVYYIPYQYITSEFKLRFYLDGFGESGKYAYIDNISLSCRETGRWNAGADWDVESGQLRGHHAGNESDRYLTLEEDIDLSVYEEGDIRLAWSQDESGSIEDDQDALLYRLSGDGGLTWSDWETAFSIDDPLSPFTRDLTADYLTSGFRIQYFLQDFTDENAYLDNIRIEVRQDNENGWLFGADWDIYESQFRGHHDTDNDEADRYLQMDYSVNLSAYQGTEVQISWDQSSGGYLESLDKLQYQFSANGGATWGALSTAFQGGSWISDFSGVIPNGYLTDDFRLRFYLDGFTGSDYFGDEYAFIDNIRIYREDFGVNHVMFNGQEIVADRQQVDQNEGTTYSYSCFYDATDFINAMIENSELGANGSGTYTLGHVLRSRPDDPGFSVPLYPSGATGYPLGIPDTDTSYAQWAYAGWSLILIYTSPEVEGHQMYLYDDFTYVGGGDTVNLPITGFLTPPNPAGSRLTCFVGEGDSHYTGDCVRLNGHLLGDIVNPEDNVFNSYSNALDNPSLNGIDLDTFNISTFVEPGDTSADFETYTPTDVYNIVYIILSFRHNTSFGGTVSYLIRS